MRRRLFLPAAVCAALLLLAQAASLFILLWTSPDGSFRIGFAQGCFQYWHGRAGDFPRSPSGLLIRGWSADALIWKPEAARDAKVWVAAMPPKMMSGASIPLRQITGTSVLIPVLYPLALALITGGLTFLTWRRHRRLARHQCPRCRYDQRGLPTPRCPECGELLRRLLTRLRRARPFSNRPAYPAPPR